MCHAPMMPAKNEPHTSLFQLLKAVEVANEIEEAAPARRDSQPLVAHDHVLVQCREAHTSSLIHLQLLKAVEVAHEIEEAAVRRGDSEPLVAHDHVLVQRRRKQRGSDMLNQHCSFELLGRAEEIGNFEKSAPVLLSYQHSRDAVRLEHCLLPSQAM
ncbi:hypothetical protein T484DRAFT_1922003 [Baffinella frigidus]|nr:hypothetical protein T484DRAFT_1922003 [Cryptophyta sp. CCMP2293]